MKRRKSMREINEGAANMGTTVSHCQFTVMPEAKEAVIARAEVFKAMAEAFSKVADSLKAGTNSAPIIEIKP